MTASALSAERKIKMFLFSWYRRYKLWLFKSIIRFGKWLVVTFNGNLDAFCTTLLISIHEETNPAMRADYEKCFREVFNG